MKQEKLKELEKLICSDYGNITGLIVQKGDLRLYENYFNGFRADDAVHVFSVTKSIFSALIGIAVGKGLIKEVDQKVLDFFPEYRIKAGESAIQNITIEHLLTMTAPYKCKPEPYEEFFTSADWVKFALDLLGGEEPAGEFLYSPLMGTHILSGVLQKAVGQPILDFAAQQLFSPLGIHISRSIMFHNKEEQFTFYEQEKHCRGWVADPQGLHAASWGLTLTTEDMIKFGQLFLNSGMWNRQQILPSDWVRRCTEVHSRRGQLSYGYLWWIMDEMHGIYAAMGDGGNVIYVNTKKNMVVSIAALFKQDIKDSITLINERIEPLFE